MTNEPTDTEADEILAEIAADDYYAIVPEWILFHADLSHGAVRLYGVLRRFADQRGIAFPGLSAIGQKYGCVPRSVTRHMDELIAAGAVTKKRRIGKTGGATSNLYRVHSRPTFVQVEHDFTPSTSAAVKARAKARTKVSEGGSDKSVRGGSDESVRLTTATPNHNQDEPQGSAARSAATATPVETSSSSSTSRNASAPAAAAQKPSTTRASATRGTPTILAAAGLDPAQAGRFRAWLVTATSATNPDGLIVTLNNTGQLPERLSQWRASEDPTQVPGPGRVTHLTWCGDCDRATRTAVAHDTDGREYVRRCPVCNVNAASTTQASSWAARGPVAATSDPTAANAYEAARAARAALPAGVGRRTRTIGNVVDIATARAAQESAQ